MDFAQLKSQLMAMFMMKSATNPSPTDNFLQLFYTMVLMSIIDGVFRHTPALFKWCEEYATKRAAKALPGISNTPGIERTNSVLLVRSYAGKASGTESDNIYVEKVDAVLDYICRIDEARHIRIDRRCVVVNTDAFELTPTISARLREMDGGDGGASVHLTLYSKELQVSELRAWIDEVHAAFVLEKSNRLGNRIFYFNEIPSEPPKTLDPNTKQEMYRMELAPKALQFTMNEFQTFKSFDNIYGEHMDELKERLDLFINHPEWYRERGIPYSLGILMHGKPGSGKTSTIKAIAHDTRRHIFNLSLRRTTTPNQLSNLFYNEVVSVLVDGQLQTYKIPLNRRIYVFEDVDCLSDVVLDRELLAAAPTDMPKKASVEGGLTLSYLLNLFDGVLETPGRILVMTSNYPERLDAALIRPGRIDVKIEFGNATRAMICDMVNHFYDLELDVDDIPEEADNFFTPAEAMEILCTHFKDYEGALAAMRRRATTVSAGVKAMLGTALEEPEPEPEPELVIEEILTTAATQPQEIPTDSPHATVIPVNETIVVPSPKINIIEEKAPTKSQSLPSYDEMFSLGNSSQLYEKYRTNPDGAKEAANNLDGLEGFSDSILQVSKEDINNDDLITKMRHTFEPSMDEYFSGRSTLTVKGPFSDNVILRTREQFEEVFGK